MPDKRVTELTAIDAVTGTDLVMVVDDPAGTPISKKATVNQVLTNAAKTNVSNTFTGDQTIDGDLFVTGDVTPIRLREQLPKIDALEGRTAGTPGGSRTLMSQSLVSGLAVRHDETLGQGKIAVGNYDTQMYQPLLFEVESVQVSTGVSPGTRVEHLRVHPSGAVTVGTDHTVDPGTGVVQAGGLGTTPLDAAQLLNGTVPDARLSTNVATRSSKNFFSDDQFIQKPGASLRMVDTNGPVDGKLWVIGCDVQPDFYIQSRMDNGATTAHTIFKRGGDVKIAKDLYEKGRSVAMGEWIDVPYNPADYIASSGMTWTVDAADVVNYSYALVGKMMFVIVYLDATSIGGTLGPKLYVQLPNNVQVRKTSQFPALAFDNASPWAQVAVITRIPSDSNYVGNYIEFYRVDGLNWSASTNRTFIRGNLFLPLA